MATVTNKNPVIDLKTKKGKDFFCSNDFDHKEFPNIKDYLEKGEEARIVHGETNIYTDRDDTDVHFCILNNAIYYDIHPITSARDISRFCPEGIVVNTTRRFGKNKNFKHIVIIDADLRGNMNQFMESIDADMPCISFTCLARFFDDPIDPDDMKLAQLFAKGDLVLVDFTADETKKPTKEEQKQISRKKRNGTSLPRKDGFTLVNGKWHRPSTVLIRDMRKNGKTVLFGQDEGTYFGCELKDHPKTIEEAFVSLTPPEVRGKNNVSRQGEWFAVPVSEDAVPKREESVAFVSDNGSFISLPVEHADSNEHTLSSTKTRIAKDGTIFALDAVLCHNDHEELSLNGWVKFIRNTALRSFSEQGVD